MRTTAVLISGPRQLALEDLELTAPTIGDVVVEVAHSGISTGTEKLFSRLIYQSNPAVLVHREQTVVHILKDIAGISPGAQIGFVKGCVFLIHHHIAEGQCSGNEQKDGYHR